MPHKANAARRHHIPLRDAAEHRLPVLHKPVPPVALRQELERRLAAE